VLKTAEAGVALLLTAVCHGMVAVDAAAVITPAAVVLTALLNDHGIAAAGLAVAAEAQGILYGAHVAPAAPA
jgi:hypothetical protein